MLIEAGIVNLKLGQTQHAFNHFKAALELDGASPRALIGAGCISQVNEIA